MPLSNNPPRKAFLVRIPIALIKDIQKASIDDDRYMSDIVEDALNEWLAKRASK